MQVTFEDRAEIYPRSESARDKAFRQALRTARLQGLVPLVRFDAGANSFGTAFGFLSYSALRNHEFLIITVTSSFFCHLGLIVHY